MPPRDGEPLLSPRLSDKALANKNPCPALSHVRTGISERQLWQGLPHLQSLQDSEVLWRRTYGWHSSRELFIWLTRLFGEGCTRSPTSKHASDQTHLAFIHFITICFGQNSDSTWFTLSTNKLFLNVRLSGRNCNCWIFWLAPSRWRLHFQSASTGCKPIFFLNNKQSLIWPRCDFELVKLIFNIWSPDIYLKDKNL